jgi:ubiquitin carboxyl-terminal hydrolase 2/21
MGNNAGKQQHVQEVKTRRKSKGGRKKGSSVRQHMHFDLSTGDTIHVLDSFTSKKDNCAKYKWRDAEVVQIRGTEVDIHFCGWHESWDETIDVAEESQRIRHGEEEVPTGHVNAYGDAEATVGVRRQERERTTQQAGMQIPGATERLSLGEDEHQGAEADYDDDAAQGSDAGSYGRGYSKSAQAEGTSNSNESRRELVRRMAQQQEALKGVPREHAMQLRQNGGLVGLRNLGNTCYMNSALQCLCAIPQMAHYFLENQHQHDIDNRYSPSKTKGRLAVEFGKVVHNIWDGEEFSTFAPNGLKRMVGAVQRSFESYQQQDCQEFLRFLLDGLHEDLNRITRKPSYEEIKDPARGEPLGEQAMRWWRHHCERNSSEIMDVFCGQLYSQVRCKSCKHVSSTFDPFFDLSIPVPSKSNVGIEDCLRLFSSEENLSVKEGYHCTKCQRQRACTKRLSIFRSPKVLLLHLKRFQHESYRSAKINTTVRLQLEDLQLGPCLYTGPDAEWRRQGGCGGVDGEGGGDDWEQGTSGMPVYDLVAVANHMGTLEGGHYTADCVHAPTKKWLNFDDSTVSEISPRDICGRSAYCVFYVRRD